MIDEHFTQDSPEGVSITDEAAELVRKYATLVADRGFAERELLVAQAILKYPNVPITRIRLIQEPYGAGMAWRVEIMPEGV
jgi:hypothetical protein